MNRISRTFEFEFDHSIERLWAVISNTPRWGEASGFPRYQAGEQLAPDGSVKVLAQTEIAGIPLRWEEPPSNWVYGKWFEQQRLFLNGSIERMTSRAELEVAGQGSRSFPAVGARGNTRFPLGHTVSQVPGFEIERK